MKKLAVVILNWNGEKMLEEYLPSVINSCPEYAEVILADNASTDNSVRFVQENYPDLRIIVNQENHGFARGYNDALKGVNHEYIVLLNSDIETPKNWIEPVFDFMESNPDVGIAMPKIHQIADKNSYEYAGAGGGFIDKLGYPFCRGRLFDTLEKDNGQYNTNLEVFWATGACMFVRNDLFKKLGGLDEFFFAHMEEIDFCWRAKRAGHQVYSIGNAHVYHLGGGTLKKLNPKKTYLNFRNNLLMLIKNHPSKGFASTIFKKLILDGIAGVKFLLQGNIGHTIAIIKAHFSMYANFSKYMKIRKQLQKDYGDAPVSKVYQNLIIWDYFKKKKTKYSDLSSDQFS